MEVVCGNPEKKGEGKEKKGERKSILRTLSMVTASAHSRITSSFALISLIKGKNSISNDLDVIENFFHPNCGSANGSKYK